LVKFSRSVVLHPSYSNVNFKTISGLLIFALTFTTINPEVSISVQQDATTYSLLYFCKLLYMFLWYLPSGR